MNINEIIKSNLSDQEITRIIEGLTENEGYIFPETIYRYLLIDYNPNEYQPYNLELKALLYDVYKEWISKVINFTEEELTEIETKYRQDIRKFIPYFQYLYKQIPLLSENATNEEKAKYIDDLERDTTYITLGKNGVTPFLYEGGFYHILGNRIYGYTKHNTIDYRLYFNPTLSNRPELFKSLLIKFKEDGIDLYGKIPADETGIFGNAPERKDGIVLYIAKEDIEKAIECVRKLHESNPELFECCENQCHFWYNIDGYIGFGEEPKEDGESFSSKCSQRFVDALTDIVKPKVSLTKKELREWIEKNGIESFLTLFKQKYFETSIDMETTNFTSINDSSLDKPITIDSEVRHLEQEDIRTNTERNIDDETNVRQLRNKPKLLTNTRFVNTINRIKDVAARVYGVSALLLKEKMELLKAGKLTIGFKNVKPNFNRAKELWHSKEIYVPAQNLRKLLNKPKNLKNIKFVSKEKVKNIAARIFGVSVILLKQRINLMKTGKLKFGFKYIKPNLEEIKALWASEIAYMPAHDFKIFVEEFKKALLEFLNKSYGYASKNMIINKNSEEFYR